VFTIATPRKKVPPAPLSPVYAPDRSLAVHDRTGGSGVGVAGGSVGRGVDAMKGTAGIGE
jgi:hypothetical protein